MRSQPRYVARGLVALVVALSGVLLVGCATVSRPVAAASTPGADAAARGPGPPGGAAGPSVPQPDGLPSFTPVTAPSLTAAQLVADLVPAPAGSQPWPGDAASGAGVLTLTEVVQDLYAEAGTADQQRVADVETARGFQYAVRRNWITTSGTKADLYLFKFATVEGAASFFNDHAANDGTAAGPAGTFHVPDAGDAVGFAIAGIDAQGDAAVEMVDQRGAVGVLIEYFTPAQPDRAGATGLVQEQYARLPDILA